MTKRVPLKMVSVVEVNNESVPYALTLPKERKEAIQVAKQVSNLSWSEWVSIALDGLISEAPDEIASLLNSCPPSSNKHTRLPFRLYVRDQERAKALALEYDVQLRSVLLMALTRQSFVPTSLV